MTKGSTSQGFCLALPDAAQRWNADDTEQIARSMMANRIGQWPDAAHAGGMR